MPKCPQCGAILPPNAPAGLCPNCLMALNLKTETVLTGDTPAAQPPLSPEQIAPHFPQLEILECLGRGGMGVVYKARQKSLNRLVALKLLAPERVNDPRFAERFTREAQALAALNHPNIVIIHDFGQAGGFYFLLMEFVDGVNLRHLLRARKFTPEEALAIVPRLCDALQFAHEHGIVHRDIKPENILLDKTGRVKVADFGIAKMLGNGNGEPGGKTVSPENVTQSVLGTPGYIAPEQKSDPQRVDSRADIYSLGVVFYEMLTGELPGKPIEAPSHKVQIDVRLDEVVLRALEQKPELRYQQASVLKTQVETIASTPESSPPAAATTDKAEFRKRFGDTPPAYGWRAAFGQAPTLWCRFMEQMLGVTLTSPLAIRLMNLSQLGLLGFLGSLGFLGYVWLPESHWCFGFFGLGGFLGFFGLIGLAFMLERTETANILNNATGLPKLRWEVTIWGFILMLGWIDAGLHTSNIGWLIEAGGVLLFLIPTLFAWLSGDDLGQARFAGQIVLINGIVMASVGIWGAVNSLEVAWAVPISLACLGGVVFCLRCLMQAAKAEAQTPVNLARFALGCALMGGLIFASLFWLQTSWFFAGDIRIWLTPVFALLAIVLGGISRRFRLALPAMILGGLSLLLWLPMLIAGQRQSPDTVIAEVMQREVGRQLREAGATYDDLRVAVAEKRSSATPFTVTYTGLRHFKYTYGGRADPNWPDRANGQFVMQYIGGGTWQGTLGDQHFEVQVGSVDILDLPFVNDPQVLGEWQTVDFIANVADFNPAKPNWPHDKLYLQDLTFLENGKMPQSWMTWTKGLVMHHGDQTASHYEIREISGKSYLFFEWKSGDVTILGMKPRYYVLKKKPSGIPLPPAAASSVVERMQAAFDEINRIKGMSSGRQYELNVGGEKIMGEGDDFLRRRTGAEILDSGLSSGCGDYAMAFVHLLDQHGLETLFIDSAEISLSSLESHFSGHVVVAVRDPAGDRWLLADPTSRQIITNHWLTNSQTFYHDRYWIGYCGALSNYPAHSPDELKDFYARTLARVPADFWDKHIFKFDFKIDPSLIGQNGDYLAPHVPQFAENQDAALANFHIHPQTEIPILLVKGGNDSNSTLNHSAERGWVCTVGLQSACSLGLVTYMQNVVAGAPPEQLRKPQLKQPPNQNTRL